MSPVGYRLFKAPNVLDIKEQQYGSGTEVRFSKFTSCMGIIAKQDANLYAVHLVQQGVYNEADRGHDHVEMKILGFLEALEIGGIFPLKLEFAIFIGNTGGFKYGVCAKAYQKLVATFEERTTLYRNYQDDGIFGARLDAKEPHGVLLYESLGGDRERKIKIETSV